jgi:hypothetical protein
MWLVNQPDGSLGRSEHVHRSPTGAPLGRTDLASVTIGYEDLRDL